MDSDGGNFAGKQKSVGEKAVDDFFETRKDMIAWHDRNHCRHTTYAMV